MGTDASACSKHDTLQGYTEHAVCPPLALSEVNCRGDIRALAGPCKVPITTASVAPACSAGRMRDTQHALYGLVKCRV